MRGNNMAPLITQGARFGVDTREDGITSGQIYALFAPNEGLVLRRIFLDGAQAAYLLRSESPDFPETTLAPELARQRLLGRVVWTLQEF